MQKAHVHVYLRKFLRHYAILQPNAMFEYRQSVLYFYKAS